MPWESIGEYEIGEYGDPDWVEFSQDVILQYLLLTVGEPPEGCELGFFEQDHELGVYTIVGVHWDDTRGEPPYQYISRAEKMLERFNKLEWSLLYPIGEEEENEDEGGK